jgi:ubiquinone/menaquinone biosynthesis C-methylase UbiE
MDLPHLPAGSAVLELGCGDGKTLSAMPGDWKIVALDISRQALQFSRRLLPDVELVLADACRLPLQSASFDAVFAFHVAGHLLAEGRRALACEAARVLVRGGKLFFRDFGTDDMRAGLGEEVESGTFRRGTGILTRYFTESEVGGIFCELELATISTHRWKLRVKGQDLQRSEVEAVFIKS